MQIIFTTFDAHRNLLEANKYIMDIRGVAFPVTILGFKRPDFDLGAWKFVSMGEYRGAERFTDDITPFFNQFTDEYFIMGNDDTLLTNQFNFELLEKITVIVNTMPNFGRIWLTGGVHAGRSIVDFGTSQMVLLSQTANYRLSLQWSLWKTSYFKKYLVSGLSPWDWELRETAKNDGADILSINGDFVVSIGHLMKKGRLLPNWNRSIYNDGELSDFETSKCMEILKKHGYL